MIVLVTGATGSLGPAVADAFERRGDTVVRVARSGPVRADLTRAEEARRVVEDVISHHGRLDVLAHVLGGFEGGQPLTGTSDETWARMIGLNLSAAFYTLRAAAAQMMGQKQGRIVAVGSRAGVHPAAGLSAYNVSKAGLHMLVQTLALELKDSGVTANAVLPSSIGGESGVPPEAIADLIVWLTSDAAVYVNGALLPVYGRG